MSQAEHDKMASAILLTTSTMVANKTVEELERQMQTLSRREIIEQSLTDFGAIIVCNSIDEAVDFANELAPEHLEMAVQNPLEYIGRIDNAERFPRAVFARTAGRLFCGSQPRFADQRHRAVLLAAFGGFFH